MGIIFRGFLFTTPPRHHMHTLAYGCHSTSTPTCHGAIQKSGGKNRVCLSASPCRGKNCLRVRMEGSLESRRQSRYHIFVSFVQVCMRVSTKQKLRAGRPPKISWSDELGISL